MQGIQQAVILVAADSPVGLLRRGVAALFRGTQQIHVSLGRTPLGKPHPLAEPVPPGRPDQVSRDWKITPPDSLPEIVEQLNRGQSAEAITADGSPIRLLVNRKQRSRGVELLVPQPARTAERRDYHKVAARTLTQHLGDWVDPDEMEELTCSVVKQWQTYAGSAALLQRLGRVASWLIGRVERQRNAR